MQLIKVLSLASVATAVVQWPLSRHPRALGRILSTRGGSDKEVVEMFPAMSEEEIAEKLNTIPVFGITDAKGQSIVHKMADGSLVNHVFLNKALADEMLNQFKKMAEGGENAVPDGGRDLQVSDVPLGMLWGKLTEPEGATGAGSSNAQKTEEGLSVQLRLIADPADLQIARNMTASMQQEFESATEEASEVADAMSKKVSKLQEPWGVVPVFTMYGMKIRVKESNEPDAPVRELLPWFLSIEECVKSSKKAAGVEEGNESAEEMEKLKGMSINMSTLNEIAAAMGKESSVDFRNVIFMPSAAAIAHMKEKIGRLMKEQSAGTAGGKPSELPSSSPSSPKESGGIYDEDDDEDASENPFK